MGKPQLIINESGPQAEGIIVFSQNRGQMPIYSKAIAGDVLVALLALGYLDTDDIPELEKKIMNSNLPEEPVYIPTSAKFIPEPEDGICDQSIHLK